MEYETVIGLEVHVELKTKSKIFCGCSTVFGGDPNTQCCPVCSGLPGSLPVLNIKAVEYAVKAGIAANCSISGHSVLDRKNYFYPDLPKAYQISQLYKPLCVNGYIEIETNNVKKKIRIREIHLEEDAGKLIHEEFGRGTFVDLNRCGVPLIEIVTEPDLRSSEEVKTFLGILKTILAYTDVSDCKMQEGSLRADINLSVREKGNIRLGIRTEMKNLNSFKAIFRAIDTEAERQILTLEKGGKVVQETRRWDDIKCMSSVMRSKEEAHDYRYFPEPDLRPIEVNKQWLRDIRESIPELPEARAKRYRDLFILPDHDSTVLTSSIFLSDFFEMTVKCGADPKSVSNWLMGDYMKFFNESAEEEYNFAFKPESLAKMIKLIHDGYISGKIAKEVFREMYQTGRGPEDIIREKGLSIIDDADQLESLIVKIISENTRSVEDIRNGKNKAVGFLIGQVMKKTEGKADPNMVNEILNKLLSELKQEGK